MRRLRVRAVVTYLLERIEPVVNPPISQRLLSGILMPIHHTAKYAHMLAGVVEVEDDIASGSRWRPVSNCTAHRLP